MKTAVFDLHHEVLYAWEECRKVLASPPEVFSLDFHTDVLNSARRGVELPENGKEAVKILHHDEHFDWALRAGIISRAVIVALSPCAVAPEHPGLTVRRSDLLPDMEKMLNSPEDFRPVAEKVLDDRFLQPLLNDGFPAGKFILDIDCDYLLCEKALFPEEHTLIDALAQQAELITLSRENDWVKILKLPGEKITGTALAEQLISRWEK